MIVNKFQNVKLLAYNNIFKIIMSIGKVILN